MLKTFTIKQTTFQFSDEDVKQVASTMNPGVSDRVRFYVKVRAQLYPVRQLLVKMVRQKGMTMPDITAHEAIRILRALGFEITEQGDQEQDIREVPPPPKSFSIKCTYCEGTGKDPGPGNITGEDCRKCKGTGRRNLPGSEEDYTTDEICKGTGRNLRSDDPWEPCHICDGTGKVRRIG